MSFSRNQQRSLLRKFVGAAAVCGLPALCVGGSVAIDTIALTSAPAPGTDVSFAAFTTGLNHNIMAPRIDHAGNVAFIATLMGPDVTDQNNHGIWSNSSGALELVIRSGDEAPGVPTDNPFVGVPSNYLPFPPTFSGARTTFAGELTSDGLDFTERFGVWKEAANGIELVARGGDAAAGLPAGTTYGNLGAAGMSDAGAVMINGTVYGPGVDSSNNQVLWSDRNGQLEVFIREGDQAPGVAAGVVFSRGVFGTPDTAFLESVIASNGILATAANLQGPNVAGGNDEALFAENGITGELELVARDGDPAPGFDNGWWFSGGSVLARFRGLQYNAAGDVAFSARVGDFNNSATAIYVRRAGQLLLQAFSGGPAPDVPWNFGALTRPLLNDQGHVVLGSTTPDGQWPTNFFAIWRDMGDGLRLLIKPGDSIDGMTATSAYAIALGGDGSLLFNVTIDNPNVFQSGIAVAYPDDTFDIIALTGDTIDVAGDGSDLRDIVRVVPGGISNNGIVVFRADFADGSSGHFTATTTATLLGDLNCDGFVSVSDIGAFVMALTQPSQYAATFADCDMSGADINGDGVASVGDIGPFVTILTGL